MAPHNPQPAWAAEIIHARGMLRAGDLRVPCRCVDLTGPQLLLAPLVSPGHGEVDPGTPASFEVPTPLGIVRVTGALSGPLQAILGGAPLRAFQLLAHPGGFERVNRRGSYRLAITLKAEMIVLDGPPDSDPGLASLAGARVPGESCLEALARGLEVRRRPCLVRDISLGGMRLSVPEPLLPRGAWVLVDVRLGPEEVLRNLVGIVLECTGDVYLPPFPGEARVRFHGLPARTQTRLSKFIVRAQVELIRKGVRP